MPETLGPKHLPHFSSIMWQTLRSPEVGFFLLVGHVVLSACVGLFYWVEVDANPQVNSVFDAFWWAFATISTVGFGDVVPVTNAGRGVGLVLMGGGVVWFAGTTAVFVTSFIGRVQSARQSEQRTEFQELCHRLDALSERLERIEQLQGARPRSEDDDVRA